MKKTISLSIGLFNEYFRDKIFYFIFSLSLLLLFSSFILQEMVVGEPGKVFKDMALNGITLFAVAIPVFLTSQMIASQIQRKSIYLILSFPLSYPSIVTAHLLASLYIITISVFSYGILAFGLILPFETWAWQIMVHGLLAIFLGLLLSAWAIFFSSITSSTLAALSTFLMYAVGSTFQTALEYSQAQGGSMFYFLKIIGYIVPNSSVFDLKPELIYRLPFSKEILWLAPLYAISFSMILVYLSSLILSRREI